MGSVLSIYPVITITHKKGGAYVLILRSGSFERYKVQVQTDGTPGENNESSSSTGVIGENMVGSSFHYHNHNTYKPLRKKKV